MTIPSLAAIDHEIRRRTETPSIDEEVRALERLGQMLGTDPVRWLLGEE